MYAFLKSVHYVSLLLLCGGPAFWFAIWQPIYGNPSAPVSARFAQRVRCGVVLGAILFIVSGLAEAVRAASQVVDPNIFEELWLFLSVSHYGQMSLLKAMLTPVLAVIFLLTYRRAKPLAMALTGVVGLALLCTISLTSHAAARPGVIPFLSDLVHIFAVVIWGGGLLYFAGLPWRLVRADLASHTRSIGRLVERFSVLAMAAVLAIAATGAIAAFLHVYGLEALQTTPYGRTLFGKLIMFGVALGIAGVHLLVIGPGLKRQARRFAPARAAQLVQRLQRLVQIEAGLILAGMVLAGVLTTFSPAERPGHIVRQDWQELLGDMQLRLTMAPTNEIGGVQFEIALQQHGAPAPSDTRVSLYMRMVDHDMGLSNMAATPVSPGQYRASSLVSMAGVWQVEVNVQPPQAPALQTTVDFEAPTGALDLGRIRRLDLSTLTFSWVNALSCVLGGLIIALAIFMIWASKRGRLPVWATPFGLLLMACGGALGLSVVLVDAYPTTYIKNPLPRETQVVERGAALFLTHCSVCHGQTGRGNGPAAAGLNPQPANLTSPHVDDHTDGDIFWWLNYGIAGSAMPSFQDTLSDTERWELIRFIRSLRHPLAENG
ncbi:CopD family protein [Candidatus Entotheonella palauensis]|uniref:CopD family protein n=1 Tax=Candidatus Entotheonella palauensis TaxID=93172 RepID=UPI000B7E49CA|nr:CopD family protein [Candidatus Entotheonella palauensis]